MPDNSVVVQVRLSRDQLAGLDLVRGETKRSTWLKGLLAAAVAVREQEGRPCGFNVVAVRRD
jgi:hypothetical protein